MDKQPEEAKTSNIEVEKAIVYDDQGMQLTCGHWSGSLHCAHTSNKDFDSNNFETWSVEALRSVNLLYVD